MTQNASIKVLIVEDSLSCQLLLTEILTSDPRIQVIGTAQSGEEAFTLLNRLKPDLILMDIQMPGMNGLHITRKIMETNPVPIVVCSSSVNPSDPNTTFGSLAAGAVSVVAKPVGPGHKDFDTEASKLIETVKLMAEVKVVKRWSSGHLLRKTPKINGSIPVIAPSEQISVIAIGASTGGPPALQTILSALPKDFPAGIMIVQHIAPGFLPGMVQWISQTTRFQTKIATHGEKLLPGTAYFAPDNFHMGLLPEGEICLSSASAEYGVRPSVNYLFRSVASARGLKSVGILLTGMGKDGAASLKVLKDSGAITIAQDRETSVVHGMPGEAINLGAAKYILSLEAIPSLLVELVCNKVHALHST